MADNESSLRQTLDYFLADRAKKIEDIKRVDLTIMQLRQALGDPVEAGEQVDVVPALITPTTFTPAPSRPNGSRPAIRPDEFFGLQYSDAARNYLRKVGSAVSLDDLLDALRNGGCKVGGTDPKRVLYISLVRNTRDFVPTGNGFIGLREFYPNLPKAKSLNGKKAKKGKKSKRKSTGRTKGATKADSTPTEAARPDADGGKLKEVVLGVMKSGEFMDGKEILRNVAERFEGKVAPISVYGMLRNKGSFEKNAEGKYRVVAH